MNWCASRWKFHSARQVPHGKVDPKVADNFECWIEAEGMLLGDEVIRVMTNARGMSGDVAIWGEQRPGRQRTGTGREGSPAAYQAGDNRRWPTQ